MSKYIDLTQTFTDDMPVFPGDPKAELKQTVFIEKDGNNDHQLTTAMHVGTHLDAPFHMLENGIKIDAISPDHFFGNGVLIDVRGEKIINAKLIDDLIIPEASIVLLYTGFDKKFNDAAYFTSYPEIAQDFADKMVEKKIKIIGMDTSSPEHNPPWNIHKTLLKNNILIIENLANLDELVGSKKIEISALPIKLQSDAAPVRVIAKIK